MVLLRQNCCSDKIDVFSVTCASMISVFSYLYALVYGDINWLVLFDVCFFLFYYVIKIEIKRLKRFFFCLYFNPVLSRNSPSLLRLYCKCISQEIWFNEIQHVYCILVTSHFGYVELRITRSIFSIPLDFEITRLTCT